MEKTRGVYSLIRGLIEVLLRVLTWTRGILLVLELILKGLLGMRLLIVLRGVLNVRALKCLILILMLHLT